MSDLIDMLTVEHCDGDQVYDLDHVKSVAHRVIDLVHGGSWLALHFGESWLSFVVFRHASGPSTRNGVVVDGIKGSIVFYGCGSSGLRELRHTYWGDDRSQPGYLFYPNGKAITAAFAALQEWFDCD